MLRALLTTLALFAALPLGACSSAGTGSSEAGTFSTAPLLTLTGDAGLLHIEVRTSPQPPARGTCSVELTVTDPKGAPVDGLTVAMVPWMPAHGHGTSIVPTVTAAGNGKYVVTNVSLFMAGDWELRTTFDGPVSDHVAPTFQIP